MPQCAATYVLNSLSCANPSDDEDKKKRMIEASQYRSNCLIIEKYLTDYRKSKPPSCFNCAFVACSLIMCNDKLVFFHYQASAADIEKMFPVAVDGRGGRYVEESTARSQVSIHGKCRRMEIYIV